ncbi:NAD(P)H-binding protein [candidate division GN15 bacterium]|nr:NAD(P)H-binding protein [candidate division GN15 bacterium]
MTIAITTPTGNIGRKLVGQLLAEGDHDLRLLARSPEKLAEEQRLGAQVVPCDLSDMTQVVKGTEGVESLFWVNPPDMRSEDYEAHYVRLARNAAEAITANGISNVVLISSVGAHLGQGVGPVSALRQVEEIFSEVADNLTILRPTFFMENFLISAATISEHSHVFLPVKAETRLSMVATEDIAEAAAEALTKPVEGIRVEPLHGPKDYSFGEAAEIIGDALGQEVRLVTITPDQAIEALTSMGATRHVAETMVELYSAIDSGHFKDDHPRTEQTTTRTTLEDFCQRVLVPALESKEH